MKEISIDIFSAEELACKVVGLDYDKIDGDTKIIEAKLAEEFGVNVAGFKKIAERLLPLVDKGEHRKTKKEFKGFAENGVWIVKTVV